jgi:1-acyl-sn-glycerol-3-phosphate acyltransferase
MLANHTYLFDVVHVPLRFRRVPFIIASQTLFTRQPTKFLVSQVAHVIPKSKGKNDLKTIKKIYEVINKGYPILIFPEGDTTFSGETGHIEPSTMKLIKKLGLDVITCKVGCGYLSRPRWATGKRHRHRVELDYKLTISKEDLKAMSLEDIGQTINKALYHNAYDEQREKMIPHQGTRLAEGIENAVYVCPHCQAINTIRSKGNTIHCLACKKQGFIDKYGFIHDFVFDNLIDWSNYQRGFSSALRHSEIASSGMLSFMDLDSGVQTPVGNIQMLYKDDVIHIWGAHDVDIPIADVFNPTITLRRDFGFVYNDRHYMIKMDQFSASFLRIVQDKY